MKKRHEIIRRLIALLILVALAAVPGTGPAEAEIQDALPELPEIPFPYELVDTVPAEEANLWWAEQGYEEPPYMPGTMTEIIRLTEDTVFARVFDGEVSGKFGGWIMDYEALDGLTPEEIRDLFALPAVPRYRVDVILPAGCFVRRGICNSLEEWGKGGGIQYDMMGERIGEFVNDRPLEEEEHPNDEAV